MNLTKAEQQFVSHIRTLHLKKKSTRKDQIIDFVFLSLKTIRANYFSKEYETVFDKLKSLKEIDYEKITRVNGGYFFKFKALKDGPIDFSLLKEHSRKLDNLERMVKGHLRWVSIEQGEDIYIKFQEKLSLQNRDDAKTKFYEITFGKANQRLADLFGNSNWIQWVNEVKSTSLTQNPNSNKKPHSNLAWLLQTTEVTIMRTIWQKLIDNDIIFLSVHDEVIVRESEADEVCKIVIDELKLHFDTFKVNVKSVLN